MPRQRHRVQSSNTGPANQLPPLLKPLYDAGWQSIGSGSPADRQHDHQEYGCVSEVLRRSCMVVQVTYFPDQDLVWFEHALSAIDPAVLEKHDPRDSLGLHDAIGSPEPVKVLGDSAAGLAAAVEQTAGRLGLLDPTRFRAEPHSARTQRDIFARLYLTYVAIPAVKWHWPRLHRHRALRLLDTDPDFSNQLRWLAMYAPTVVPDPVPITAAIGLTLECWRNTLLESIHASDRAAGGHGLTDVAMAKLNITTTRALSTFIFITSHGVQWEQVSQYLTDPERALPDGRTVGALVGRHWLALKRDLKEKLAAWRRLEAVLGPEPTLRMLAATGSTDMTAHWWGNSWWPAVAGTCLAGLDWQRIPELRDYGDADGLELLSDLQNQPETLPDKVLALLIAPPAGRGSGLREFKLPERPAHILRLE